MAKGGRPQKDTASPRIKAAWRLLEEGDVVRARREARAALATPVDPGEADQARQLLEQLRTPRQVYYLAGIAAALVVTMLLLGLLRA